MQRAWGWKELALKAFSVISQGSLWEAQTWVVSVWCPSRKLRLPSVVGTEKKLTDRQRPCVEENGRPSPRRFLQDMSSKQGGVGGEWVPSQWPLMCG